MRFRASDGFSHARSLAFVISLLLVQGVIVLVGLAAALGDTDLSAIDRARHHRGGAGPGGKGADQRGLPRVQAPAHPVSTSSSSSSGSTALITGTTLMGQIERALNRLYGIEQDRPTLQKYGRAFVLALTAGVLATWRSRMFALGHGIGAGHRRRHRHADLGRRPLADRARARWRRPSRCSSGGRPVATSPRGRGWRSARRCRCCCGRWSRSVSGSSSSRAPRSAGPTAHSPE